MTWTSDRLQHLRRETPGCLKRIHFDNAGAGLMSRSTLETVLRHLELEAEIGGYQAFDSRRRETEAAREHLARLIGCPAENLAIVENATAGYIQALSSIPFQRGDLILTSRDDYVSNQIMFLSLRRRLGVEVAYVPNQQSGGLDLQALEEMIKARRPRLMALTHVPTNSGLLQPAVEVGHLCRRFEVPYLLDACQSLGQMPLDVEELGCDFLSATSRKYLRGPRGVGILYASPRLLQKGISPLFPDLHGALWREADRFEPVPGARRFENWEFPWALVLGAGEAARQALELGLGEIRERSFDLATRLRLRMNDIPGVQTVDLAPQLCAIVTARVAWKGDPEELKQTLFTQGINVSISYRSYALLHFNADTEWTLRASPHYYNTEEEIECFCHKVKQLVSSSRRASPAR